MAYLLLGLVTQVSQTWNTVLENLMQIDTAFDELEIGVVNKTPPYTYTLSMLKKR